MLDKLVTVLTDWPVLVQGVLGSAFFWLILMLGQKTAMVVSAKYAATSRKRRESFLVEERLKYALQEATNTVEHTAYLSALLYRAFRHAIRAAIWLTLGLITSSFLPVIGAVGYIGCLYYLFAAFNVVKGVSNDEDTSAKLKELTDELNKLNEV